jgi:hypothetical protein
LALSFAFLTFKTLSPPILRDDLVYRSVIHPSIYSLGFQSQLHHTFRSPSHSLNICVKAGDRALSCCRQSARFFSI